MHGQPSLRKFSPETVALTEHVVTELGVLQAQRLELLLRLAPQCVRPCCPEARDRRADLLVLLLSVSIDVAGVGNLALGGRVDAVDLGAGEGLEVVDAELLRQGVDAGVLEELVAGVVDGRGSWIVFEDALTGELLGEVLSGVEEFEKAAYSIDVLVGKVDLAGLAWSVDGSTPHAACKTHASVVNEALADFCKVRTLSQQSLMRSKASRCFGRANRQADDWAHQEADECGRRIDNIALSKRQLASIISALSLALSTLGHLDVTAGVALGHGGCILDCVGHRCGGSMSEC